MTAGERSPVLILGGFVALALGGLALLYGLVIEGQNMPVALLGAVVALGGIALLVIAKRSPEEQGKPGRHDDAVDLNEGEDGR